MTSSGPQFWLLKADRGPEEREDEHGGTAREAVRGVKQRPCSSRPGEPACIGQIRGVEDVERRHGLPGKRTMKASVWSHMLYLTLPVVEKVVQPVLYEGMGSA